MDQVTLADVAAELYGLDPAEFVPARTAQVRGARAAGDRQLAKDIAALRKPTLVGWVVNIAARELPDDLDALLELGAALRVAQQTLSGDDLRRLTAQRQQVVRAFTRKAGAAAALRGHPVSENALREVSQTLHAALADPGVAQQVRAGTVVTAASYSGFGVTGLAAVPEEPGPSAAQQDAAQSRRLHQSEAERLAQQREQRVNEARDAADSTAAALAQARAAATAARADLDAADAEIARLRDELDHAEQTRQFLRNTERDTASQLRTAERDADRAQRTLEQLGGSSALH